MVKVICCAIKTDVPGSIIDTTTLTLLVRMVKSWPTFQFIESQKKKSGNDFALAIFKVFMSLITIWSMEIQRYFELENISHNNSIWKICTKIINKNENKMTGTAKKREIVVSKENREFLKRLFGCTEQTLYNSLDLQKPSSEMRKRIRKAALERGGEVMVTLREMETIHTANGVMEQRLPNGAELRFYREDGHGEIWHKGIMKERVDSVTIPVIYEMQARAAMMR